MSLDQRVRQLEIIIEKTHTIVEDPLTAAGIRQNLTVAKQALREANKGFRDRKNTKRIVTKLERFIDEIKKLEQKRF